jgi:hypothetical protein
MTPRKISNQSEDSDSWWDNLLQIRLRLDSHMIFSGEKTGKDPGSAVIGMFHDSHIRIPIWYEQYLPNNEKNLRSSLSLWLNTWRTRLWRMYLQIRSHSRDMSPNRKHEQDFGKLPWIRMTDNHLITRSHREYSQSNHSPLSDVLSISHTNEF